MPIIKFTKEEYFQIADSFDRIRQTIPTALVKQLSTKFTRAATEFDSYDVPLKRQHIRYLEDYCKSRLLLLSEKILPEYIKRGNKPEYEQKTKDSIKLTEGILNKIEAFL
jgi:hypothetical protein